MIKPLCVLLHIALLAAGPRICAQFTQVSDEVKSMQELTTRARKNLVVMLRTGQDVLAESGQSQTTTEQARILRDGTPVYASRYDTTTLIEYADRDDTYPVLERLPGFIRIQLSKNSEGWINANQALLTGNPSTSSVLAALSKTTAAKLEIIHRLYDGTDVLEEQFQKIYKSIPVPTPEVNAIQKSFYRHITNARVYYQTYFAGLRSRAPPVVAPANRLSGTLSMATGSSTFRDDYSASLSEEFKGGLTDIALHGLYRIDPISQVNVAIDTRSELIETPFKSKTYQLGYGRNAENTQFNASAGLNKYKDEFRGINSYNRLQVSTRLKHALNTRNALLLQYQFINNNYESASSADYSRHDLSAGTESRLKNNNLFLLQLRGNLSTSKQQHLNFLHLLPAVTFRKTEPKSSTDYSISMESFTYEDLGLRNSLRGSFGVTHRHRREPGHALNREVLISYITYPENKNIDHARISYRISKNQFIGVNRFSTFGLTAKYFMSNQRASYLDLRYDAGTTRQIFAQFAFFNRMYYPEETVLTLSEANIKLGVNIHGFKVGPVLSVRTTMNYDDVSIEADGNYYRIGAFLEGSGTFRNGLRVAVNGAYDYGHVYSEEIAVDPITGLINAGDVTARNPVTIRFSTQLNYTLMELFDLFVQGDYYKIDRDHGDISGLNPVLSSDRLSFKLGFVYRYN